MSEDESYDLKESSEGIGQLYPVLVSKDGRVIDGFHRLQADPTWRVQPLDNIDTDEKLLIARCVANWHRRPIGREEKTEWINGLAKIYQKQRLREDISLARKISETVGLAENTVAKYLHDKYKLRTHEKPTTQPPIVPASQRIEEEFDRKREGLGKEIINRFKAEVLEEAKLSPEELAKRREEQEKQKAERKRKTEERIIAKVEKKAKEIKVTEVKAELLANPEFREEVIHRDLVERYQKATEDRGTPQIWEAKRIDEAQEVLDEHIRIFEIVQGWGINQHMILKNANRLNEAWTIDQKIQNKLLEWMVTKYEQ